MKIQTHTGFSIGTVMLDSSPQKGEVFRISEFTYLVACTEWIDEDSARLWILPTAFNADNDPRAPGTSVYQPSETKNIPRAGDILNLRGGRFRVVCVEWMMSYNDPYVNLHLDDVVEEDPGIAAVIAGGEEHGSRLAASGYSMM